MNKDELIMQRRLLDLADTAWQRGVAFFSDFLSLGEQTACLLGLHIPDGVEARLFGGYEGAERCICGFVPREERYESVPDEEIFPIKALHIRPRSEKFSEPLSHRDFLGAVLNLGIDRSMTGDILVYEKEAILLCRDSMAEFICEELIRIRHTSVSCEAAELEDIRGIHPRTETVKGSISSARLDCVLSMVYKKPRNTAADMTRQGLVMVNGREITDTDRHLKAGDIVSVRGFGKFKFTGEEGITKKGRIYAQVEKYI